MMVSSTSGGGGGTTPETTCQCGYTDAAYTGGGLPKYHSYDECINDPAQKCGWGYGCDCTDPSEFKCTFKPGGMWKSQADCRCYCPPDGGDGGGSTGGTTEQMGWRCDASSTSPSGCSYVPGGPYATEADCRCFYAQGAFGPDCTCVRTESNMPASDTRAFPTMDACTSSTSFECGWKYGCDGSTVRTCSLKPSGSGGVWQKSSECVCGPPVLNWSCDPTTADPTKCVQVAFDTGQFETQEKCSCWACDASSTDPTKCSAVAAGAKGAAHTQAGCSCVYAVGNAGPGCECKYDPLLAPTVAADKQFNNMLACSRDYKSKCGWKYTCAAYGTVLQCADLNNQFYLVDDASQSLRLLTDVTGPTYDPDYKTKAVYTDCGFYNYTIGSPALAKQQ